MFLLNCDIFNKCKTAQLESTKSAEKKLFTTLENEVMCNNADKNDEI